LFVVPAGTSLFAAFYVYWRFAGYLFGFYFDFYKAAFGDCYSVEISGKFSNYGGCVTS
jgi:hypothetical protein